MKLQKLSGVLKDVAVWDNSTPAVKTSYYISKFWLREHFLKELA